jgi:peptidyl-prolyl cis-trans isomerase D
LAAAAFSVEEGRFTVISGVQGKRAIAVTEVDPGGLQPLSAVSEQIRERLANIQARAQFIDVLDQIEEMRAAFRSLDEIAAQFGLDLAELAITAGGDELAPVEKIPADGRARVATSIFSAEIGGLAPSVPLSSELNVWFDLITVEEARDQTLDEVRTEVEGAWIVEATDAAVAEAVAGYVSRIEGGEAISLVAASLGQFPEISEPFTRDGTEAGVITGAAAGAAFAGGTGYAGTGRNAEGAYIVFQVSDIIASEEPGSEDLADFLSNSLRDNLYTGFVTALREDEGLRINQQVLSDLLDLGATGQ